MFSAKFFVVVLLILLPAFFTSCLSSKTAEEWINEGDIFVEKANAQDLGVSADIMGGEAKELLEKAVKCYDEALKIDPASAEALLAKSYALTYCGKYDEAISCCDKTLEIDEKNARAWFSKGEALLRKENYRESIACFDKALEIFPGDRKTGELKRVAEKALEENK